MLGGLAGARRRLPLSDHAQQDDTCDIGSQLGGASLSLCANRLGLCCVGPLR